MEKPLIITPRNSKIIGHGCVANIYLVKNEVVKVSRSLGREKETYREYDIQKKIYDRGYPVPEPYSVLPIVTSRRRYFTEKRNNLGFFMERIYGEDLDHKGGDMDPLEDEAKDIAKDIKIALGLAPNPFYGLFPRNIMWDERKKRVVLIDFGSWGEC